MMICLPIAVALCLLLLALVLLGWDRPGLLFLIALASLVGGLIYGHYYPAYWVVAVTLYFSVALVMGAAAFWAKLSD